MGSSQTVTNVSLRVKVDISDESTDSLQVLIGNAYGTTAAESYLVIGAALPQGTWFTMDKTDVSSAPWTDFSAQYVQVVFDSYSANDIAYMDTIVVTLDGGGPLRIVTGKHQSYPS